MIEVVINKQSSKEVQKKMRELQKAFKTSGGGGAGGMKRVNRQISIWLLRWVLENFKTQGGKVGGWRPFTYGGRVVKKDAKGAGGISIARSKSIEGRRYIDTSAKLLQDTGRLRSSFKNFSTHKNAGVLSRLKYAPPHETGTKHLPQRRMLPESTDQDVNDHVYKIYDAYIQKVLRK
jgi:phage gpG-like protein